MATYYLLMPGTLLVSGDLLDAPPNVGVGQGAPPVVTVDTTGMAGQPLRVFGTDGITSWWVRGARGSQVIDRTVYHLADPLAPLNVPVIYYLVDEDGAEVQITQTMRGFAGADLLTNLDGTHGVEFIRLDNGDPRDIGLDVELFAVPGREPLPRYGPSTTGSSNVEARTEGATSRGMADLLRVSPLAVVHHNDLLCEIPECDVPRAQVVSVVAAPSRRVGTVDLARRDWSLSCTATDDPFADLFAVVSTVDMFDAAHTGMTLDDFDAAYAGMTLADFDQQVWA